MVAQTFTQGSVAELGNYLKHGDAARGNRVEDSSERVDWEAGRNVWSTSIDEVTGEMKMVTAGAEGVEKPVYQVILSWQSGNKEKGIPPDNPSREEMEEAGDRVMGALGMEEHQAWMVAHRDTDTPHLHMVINRVHPRSKEVWKDSWDQPQIYECLREMEEEKGWHRPAPMTIEEKWDLEKRGEHRESPRTLEEEKALGSSVRMWAREEGIAQRLKDKESWEGAQEVLEGTQASLEGRRGSGMVLERDGAAAAMSSIDPTISRPKLEERYGETWAAYKARQQSPLGPKRNPEEGGFTLTKTRTRETRTGDAHNEILQESPKKITLPPPVLPERYEGDTAAVHRGVRRRERRGSPLRRNEMAALAPPETWDDAQIEYALKKQGRLMPDPSARDDYSSRDLNKVRKKVEALHEIKEERAKEDVGEDPAASFEQGTQILRDRYGSYEDLQASVGKEVDQMSYDQQTDLAEMLDESQQRTTAEAVHAHRENENIRLWDKAADFYKDRLQELPEDSPKRQYIEERTHGQAEDVEIGWAPNSWNRFSEYVKQSEYGYLEDKGEEDLVRAGLATERNDGEGSFDTFKNEMVIFHRGEDGDIRKVAGHWNRGTKNPRVPELNTDYRSLRDVAAHDTTEGVFGWEDAQEREGEEVLVTEGFSDAMAARSAGRNAVALGGADFSDTQADIIAQAAEGDPPKVAVMMDGDDAGTRASKTIAEKLEDRGVDVDVVRPPRGKDADDLVSREGEDAFNEYVERQRLSSQEYVGEIDSWEEAVDLAARAPSASRREENFQELLDMRGRDDYNAIQNDFEERLREDGLNPTWVGTADERSSERVEVARGEERTVSRSARGGEARSQVQSAEELKKEMHLGPESNDPALDISSPDLETEALSGEETGSEEDQDEILESLEKIAETPERPEETLSEPISEQGDDEKHEEPEPAEDHQEEVRREEIEIPPALQGEEGEIPEMREEYLSVQRDLQKEWGDKEAREELLGKEGAEIPEVYGEHLQRPKSREVVSQSDKSKSVGFYRGDDGGLTEEGRDKANQNIVGANGVEDRLKQELGENTAVTVREARVAEDEDSIEVVSAEGEEVLVASVQGEGDREQSHYAIPKAQLEFVEETGTSERISDAREKASRQEEEFLNVAKEKFDDPDQVAKAYQENRDRQDPETARDVLMHPEKYREGGSGVESNVVDPGPTTVEASNSRLRRHGQSLQEMEEKLEAETPRDEVEEIQEEEERLIEAARTKFDDADRAEEAYRDTRDQEGTAVAQDVVMHPEKYRGRDDIQDPGPVNEPGRIDKRLQDLDNQLSETQKTIETLEKQEEKPEDEIRVSVPEKVFRVEEEARSMDQPEEQAEQDKAQDQQRASAADASREAASAETVETQSLVEENDDIPDHLTAQISAPEEVEEKLRNGNGHRLREERAANLRNKHVGTTQERHLFTQSGGEGLLNLPDKEDLDPSLRAENKERLDSFEERRFKAVGELNYSAVKNAKVTDGSLQEVERVGASYETARSKYDDGSVVPLHYMTGEGGTEGLGGDPGDGIDEVEVQYEPGKFINRYEEVPEYVGSYKVREADEVARIRSTGTEKSNVNPASINNEQIDGHVRTRGAVVQSDQYVPGSNDKGVEVSGKEAPGEFEVLETRHERSVRLADAAEESRVSDGNPEVDPVAREETVQQSRAGLGTVVRELADREEAQRESSQEQQATGESVDEQAGTEEGPEKDTPSEGLSEGADVDLEAAKDPSLGGVGEEDLEESQAGISESADGPPDAGSEEGADQSGEDAGQEETAEQTLSKVVGDRTVPDEQQAQAVRETAEKNRHLTKPGKTYEAARSHTNGETVPLREMTNEGDRIEQAQPPEIAQETDRANEEIDQAEASRQAEEPETAATELRRNEVADLMPARLEETNRGTFKISERGAVRTGEAEKESLDMAERLEERLEKEKAALEFRAETVREVRDDLQTAEDLGYETKQVEVEVEVQTPDEGEEKEDIEDRTIELSQEQKDPSWKEVEQLLETREDFLEQKRMGLSEDAGSDIEATNDALDDRLQGVPTDRLRERHEQALQRSAEFEQQRLEVNEKQRITASKVGAETSRLQREVQGDPNRTEEDLPAGPPDQDPGADDRSVEEMLSDRATLTERHESNLEQDEQVLQRSSEAKTIAEGYRREIVDRRNEEISEEAKRLQAETLATGIQASRKVQEANRAVARVADDGEDLARDWQENVEAGDAPRPGEVDLKDLETTERDRKERYESIAALEKEPLEEKIEEARALTGATRREGADQEARQQEVPEEETSPQEAAAQEAPGEERTLGENGQTKSPDQADIKVDTEGMTDVETAYREGIAETRETFDPEVVPNPASRQDRITEREQRLSEQLAKIQESRDPDAQTTEDLAEGVAKDLGRQRARREALEEAHDLSSRAEKSPEEHDLPKAQGRSERAEDPGVSQAEAESQGDDRSRSEERSEQKEKLISKTRDVVSHRGEKAKPVGKTSTRELKEAEMGLVDAVGEANEGTNPDEVPESVEQLAESLDEAGEDRMREELMQHQAYHNEATKQGLDPAEQIENGKAEEDLRNHTGEQEKAGAETLSMREYLQRRTNANDAGEKNTLDAKVSLEEVENHREGAVENLKERQNEVLQKNRKMGRMTRQLEKAGERLEKAAREGSEEEATEAYEEIVEVASEREQVRQEHAELTKNRTELGQQQGRANRVLADRGGLKDSMVKQGLDTNQRRVDIEGERKRRLGQEAEVNERVAYAVAKFQHERKYNNWSSDVSAEPESVEARLNDQADRAEEKAQKVSRLEERSQEKAQKFEQIAEQRGLDLETDQVESPDQEAREEEQADDLDQRIESLRNEKSDLEREADENTRKLRKIGQELGNEDLSERERAEKKGRYEQVRESIQTFKKKADSIEENIEELEQQRAETETQQEATRDQRPKSEAARQTSQPDQPSEVPTRRAPQAPNPAASPSETPGQEQARDGRSAQSKKIEEDSEALRSEKVREEKVQASLNDDISSRVNYAERQGESLLKDSLQMKTMTEKGGSTQQIEDLRRRFEQRRTTKAKAEEQLAQQRRGVQKKETKIKEIENALEEREAIDPESLDQRSERLEQQAEAASNLADLEEQRREYAEMQASVMRTMETQIEAGKREAPETFDPGEEVDRYEQIAERARRANSAFREQGRAAMDRAQEAQEMAETQQEETREAAQETQEVTGQKESVAKTQMREDLQTVARRERAAKREFEDQLKRPEQAREAFKQEAYKEGLDPRTRSFQQAEEKLQESPQVYERQGGKGGATATESTDAGDRQIEGGNLAKRERQVARARRDFRAKYGERAPQDVAEVLGDDEDQQLVEGLEERSIGSAKGRAKAARSLQETVKEQATKKEREFLDTAQTKFSDDQKVLRSFQENREIRGPEVARDVLRNPEDYRGEKSIVDPGLADAPREIDQKLDDIDQDLRDLERQIDAYSEIEETAEVQRAEQRSREAVAGIEGEGDRPEKTTWDRIQVPNLTRQEERRMGPQEDLEKVKADLEETVESRKPQDRVEDIMQQAQRARRREEASEMQRDLGQTLTPSSQEGGGTVEKEIGQLQNQLRAAYQGSGREQITEAEETEIQQAAEKIAQGRGPVGDRVVEAAEEMKNPPSKVQEAAETIEAAERSPNRNASDGVDLIREGINQNNEILRQAGRTAVKQDAQQIRGGEGTSRPQKVVQKAKEVRTKAKQTVMETPDDSGYNRRISERAEELSNKGRAQLADRAETDPRAQEAIERVQKHRKSSQVRSGQTEQQTASESVGSSRSGGDDQSTTQERESAKEKSESRDSEAPSRGERGSQGGGASRGR
jgi:hypothetical protein